MTFLFVPELEWRGKELEVGPFAADCVAFPGAFGVGTPLSDHKGP